MTSASPRVACYIRWSTEEQGSGTTYAVQLAACQQYARSQGWTIDSVHVDDGYSGSTLDRPALSELRAKVQRGEVDYVLVMRLDRLSRNLRDLTHLVLVEWEGRCHVRSVREPLNTDTPQGRLLFGTLAVFAEQERLQIRERTLGGSVKTLEHGRGLRGNTPFGYMHAGGGRWEIHPQEGEIVRRIFRMLADGTSPYRVAQILAAEGVRGRAGTPLMSDNIRQIAHNRAYVGEIVWGKTQAGNRKIKPAVPPEAPESSLLVQQERSRRWATSKVRRDAPLIHVQSQAHPPLIDRDLFERVQAVLAERSRRRKARSAAPAAGEQGSGEHLLLLGGVALCTCGAPIVNYHHGGSNGRTLRHFYCCRWAKPGSHARCPDGSSWAPVSVVNALVQSHLQQFLADPDTRRRLVTEPAAALEQEIQAHARQLQRTERDERELHRRVEQIYDEVLSGRRDLSTLEADQRVLQTEIARVQQQAEAIRQKIRALQEERQRYLERGRWMNEAAHWEQLAVDQRRDLLRMFLAAPIVLGCRRGSVDIRCVWITDAPKLDEPQPSAPEDATGAVRPREG